MIRPVLVLGFGVSVGVLAGILFFTKSETKNFVVEFPPLIFPTAVSASGTRATAEPIRASTLSKEMFEAAFAARSSWTVKPGTRILLVPHHLVAAREIASLIAGTPEPSTVYLIAPDHFSQGKTVFTTTDASFETAFGTVPSDPTAVASLANAMKSVSNDPKPFMKEHGVYNEMPFIATAWPSARVVPIIVRLDASQDDRLALAHELTQRLSDDPNALLVASIDFSHYLPAEIADFHDALAQDVITSLADLEADRVELDSPGALAVTLKVARDLGLGDVTIQAHTNSLRLMHAEIAQESTSHFLASFATGTIRPQEKMTLLFLGDMMFDRTVAERMRQSASEDYPFQKILGAEDRFFRGQDLIVGNLEGPVTSVRRAPAKTIDFAFDPKIVPTLKRVGIDAVSKANNHSLDQGFEGANESKKAIEDGGIVAFGDEVKDDTASSLAIIERRGQKLALLGFNTTDNPLDETAAAKSLAEAKRRASHVVVFMHWGEEYHDKPDQRQIDRAHWFIDNGADAVIGSHPHWMQSVEVYRGKPIAYSLGNFIFDQDFSAETNFGLAVGLTLSKNVGAPLAGAQPTALALHLFPIKIEKSQPRLLTGDERRARLEKLAKISDPGLKEEILKGLIR